MSELEKDHRKAKAVVMRAFTVWEKSWERVKKTTGPLPAAAEQRARSALKRASDKEIAAFDAAYLTPDA